MAARILGPIIIVVGLAYSVWIVWTQPTGALVGVGLVGLVTFTSVLFGMFLMSKEWYFESGEFRKAITISVIAVFFAIMAFGDKIVVGPSTVLGEVLNNFWAIVSTVVAFYFAARVADNRAPSNGSSKDQSAPPAAAAGAQTGEQKIKGA